MFRFGTKLTSYELWINKKLIVKYFKVFISFFYILRDRENLFKFENKNDKWIFLGYSLHNKVYNLWIQTIIESINMVVDNNLKEYVKKDIDNIIEITEKTLLE
jgi:hypothetical protein